MVLISEMVIISGTVPMTQMEQSYVAELPNDQSVWPLQTVIVKLKKEQWNNQEVTKNKLNTEGEGGREGIVRR